MGLYHMPSYEGEHSSRYITRAPCLTTSVHSTGLTCTGLTCMTTRFCHAVCLHLALFRANVHMLSKFCVCDPSPMFFLPLLSMNPPDLKWSKVPCRFGHYMRQGSSAARFQASMIGFEFQHVFNSIAKYSTETGHHLMP